jgi:L-methionine (R)-S-oxide reductase
MDSDTYAERDGSAVLAAVRTVLDSTDLHESKIARLAGVIRRAGAYRWVGLYEVHANGIGILGWSGPGVPSYPRFAVGQGLCGAAVAGGTTVIAGDVRADRRPLPTLSSTQAEMVVPIRGAAGAVVGLIDVESERLDAFTDADRVLLERCASVMADLWTTPVSSEEAQFSGE